MDITPIDAELSAKVFYNPNIMDIILNNMEGGLMQNVYLRLVSKIFNVAFISIIQKRYLTIKDYLGEKRFDGTNYEILRIERTAEQKLADIEKEQKNQLEDAKINLYVNYQSVNILKIDGYFRFLKSMNLKLDNIIFVNLSKLRRWSREILHNSIIINYIGPKNRVLNSFIGASDICFGCEICKTIAMRSQEHGPIHTRIFTRTTTLAHFRKLSINDSILDYHVNLSVLYTKEKFFQEYLYICFGRNVSCDTLAVQVSERISDRFIHNEQERDNVFEHSPLPHEVLEWLIRKWNVKYLKLEIGNKSHYSSWNEYWSTSGYLTKLVLNSPPDSEEYKTKLKPAVEHVHLDFAEASFLSVSVSEHKPAWKCILGNVQNIFSTNHFKISLSPVSHHTPELIREVLESVLKMVSEKHEKKFMIDVRYNMKLEEFSVCDDISSIWQLIQTSSYSYKFTKSTLNEQCKKRYSNEMNPYNNGEWIGKKFKLENIRNNWTINFEVWIIN